MIDYHMIKHVAKARIRFYWRRVLIMCHICPDCSHAPLNTMTTGIKHCPDCGKKKRY
tara:strand:+ start:492 stop:662 length:171 start_codon:yes stop_codon:yes gene_type:complete